MDAQTSELLAIAAAVVAASAGYGKVFGRYQFAVVEWIIQAAAVPSRYRGLLNLAVGVAIAGLFAGFAAWQAGDPRLLALGLLAGVLASVDAAEAHDRGAGLVVPATRLRSDWLDQGADEVPFSNGYHSLAPLDPR